MTTDFRALGAKIVELWDADCDIHVEINELRELLATPPTEPPTDKNTVVMLEQLRADPDDHKNYEGYEDGWIDACNAAINALLTTQTKPPSAQVACNAFPIPEVTQ